MQAKFIPPWQREMTMGMSGVAQRVHDGKVDDSISMEEAYRIAKNAGFPVAETPPAAGRERPSYVTEAKASYNEKEQTDPFLARLAKVEERESPQSTHAQRMSLIPRI
jgi:hypothetical protein